MINPTPTRIQSESERLTLLRVPRPVDVVQVQTTATTVFTALDQADFQIEGLYATNVTGTADYITLHLVPSGGSASTANTIIYQRAISANGGLTLFDRERMGLLQPGASIQALCGVNDAVNVWGYGYDYQGQYST